VAFAAPVSLRGQLTAPGGVKDLEQLRLVELHSSSMRVPPKHRGGDRRRRNDIVDRRNDSLPGTGLR
jgi:hypothetical protein